MTPAEFSKRIELLENTIPDVIENALELCANQIITDMDDRIFEESKQASGASLGKYESDSYKKWRAKRGLQTNVRDFQVTGDLKRSIRSLQTSTGRIIQFVGEKQVIKGRGLEERLYGAQKTVFIATEEDRKKGVDMAYDYVFKQNEKCT